MNPAHSLILKLKQDQQNLVKVIGNINDGIAFTTMKKKSRKWTKVKSHATDATDVG